MKRDNISVYNLWGEGGGEGGLSLHNRLQKGGGGINPLFTPGIQKAQIV